MNSSALDPQGRPIITDETKGAIRAALAEIEPGKKGALLVIADEHGARAMLAQKIGNHWKVAAGAGVPWKDGAPSGFVAVQGSW